MPQTDDQLTELERLLLLAVLRIGEEAYAAPIQDELEATAERSVSLGSIYTALLRLEEKGLCTSEFGEATPERGGRPKRFYSVTAEGQAALARARAIQERMWSGVDLSPIER